MSQARDNLRAKALTTRTPKSKIITFFGAEIELRQMKLSDAVALQTSDDQQAAAVGLLINYAYVPGTDERVFDRADEQALMAQPFGGDFLAVSNAVKELTEMDFNEQKPPSDGTNSNSQ